MSFDSSRFTFDPRNDFSGVVMQQGRVQLDSDWNEWLAELTRRIRAGTLDTLGRAVVPISTKSAFLISPGLDSVGSISIGIGAGRMYVDGLLVENHGLPAPDPRKFIPAGNPPPPTTLTPVWDLALDELEGQVGVDYNAQPYYPGSGVLAPFPQAGGPYLIYLDVWQREVTFLEDPDLVEKAVGVDTTGRIQTVWQVKWLDVSSVSGVTCSTPDDSMPAAWKNLLLPPGPRLTTGVVQSTPAGPCCLTPNTGFTGLENQLYRVEIHVPGGLAAATGPIGADVATFKWSRDNASVATVVSAITQGGTVLTVQSTGKDNVLRFSPNDWVEITDDFLELNGLPGELHQVTGVDAVAKTVTLSSAVLPSSFPVDATGLTDPARHSRLTRWDQSGKVFESDGATVWVDLNAPGSTGAIPVPPAGTTLILEDGVTIFFDLVANARPFNSGDHWEFAARATDGTVELLAQAPPRGIHHHYARLAVMGLSSVSLTPTGRITLQDRSQPPISFLTFQPTDPSTWPPNFQVTTRANSANTANFDLEVIYQPANPQGVTLPITVETFSNLSLNPAAPNFAPTVLAASKFVNVPSSNTPPSQTPVFSTGFSTGTPLSATGTIDLTDASSPPIRFLTLQTNLTTNWPPNFAVSASPSATAGNFNLEVVYTGPGGSGAALERFANLSLANLAGQVNSQFITGVATPLVAPFPALNLVAFLDCRSFWPPAFTQAPPAIHVIKTSWPNDGVVGVGTFLRGLQVVLDGSPVPPSVTSSTVIVTIEAPAPGQAGLFLSEIIAGTPTVGPGPSIITWTPPSSFALAAGAAAVQFRVRVTLKGHFIWTRSGGQLVYLDGQAFGILDGKRPDGTTMTTLVLPSGAGVRASDFESWFFLAPDAALQFTVSAGVPPTLRGEGITEEIADIIIQGTGGTPTAPGTAVPLVNITVAIGGPNVTSRLLSVPPLLLLDAVLLIDEPSAPPGSGALNTTPTPPAPPGVGGNGIDFNHGQGPNTFIGQFNPSVPNSVTFLGVPIDPPGPGSRKLRITNLRINASSAVGGTTTSAILALVTTNDTKALPIANAPPVTVGFVGSATPVAVISTSAAGGIFTINSATGVNQQLATNPAATGVVNAFVRFTEAAPGAFRPKTTNQKFVAGALYDAEETFDGTGLLPVVQGPDLNTFIGRADHGTQFVARFQNIPAGVSVFVTTRDVPPGGLQNNDLDNPPAKAILVLPASAAGQSPGGVPLGGGGRTSGQIAGIPIQILPTTQSGAEAVWEFLGPHQPGQIQTLEFGIVLAMAPGNSPPAPVTATVRLTLGPLSRTIVPSQSDPVPRFIDTSGQQGLSVFMLA